jgi:hypothetical protein
MHLSHSVQPQIAAAMEAVVLRGLLQAKQQQAHGVLQLQPQQLCLQEFHSVFAGSSTDALLQQLPNSLTELDLGNTFGAMPCSVSSSTLAAFTRLRSLSMSLQGGHLPPSLDGLTALQQLQALRIVANSQEEAVMAQRHLPLQLQHFMLLWWPAGGVEWRETWPLLQLQHLTGVRTHMIIAGTVVIFAASDRHGMQHRACWSSKEHKLLVKIVTSGRRLADRIRRLQSCKAQPRCADHNRLFLHDLQAWRP